MNTILVVLPSVLWVCLAGFNLWAMLAGWRPRNDYRLAIQMHRAAGYLFFAMFAVFVYFMLLRTKGLPDELPPRILIHQSLAWLVLPLLIAKVVVARYAKASRQLLAALGVMIFVLSFALVALNAGSFWLRRASPDKVSVVISVLFAAVVVAVLGALWWRPKGAARQNQTSGQVPRLPMPASDQALAGPSASALSLRLVRIQRQTHDAKTLRFALSGGEQFSARPGQFLTFRWMIDGQPLYRSYSICSSPTQRGYVEITPKKVPNGRVSVFLNARAHLGLTVEAYGPHGQFCFDEGRHQRIVLIAGGSGVTPMLSMLRYIDDRSLPVEATLLYCVRTRADIFFEGELVELEARIERLRCLVVLSQPDAHWKGLSGRISREMIQVSVRELNKATFFLCGPPAFMEHVREVLAGMGVDAGSILSESFTSDPTPMPQPGAAAPAARISFARAGVSCAPSPGRTVLEVAEANGVSVPFGCRQGICGTCQTRLLSGRVHMEREVGLDADRKAAGYILACVSQPLEDLTLDA